MCGIAGFAGSGTRENLRAMAGALAHRGPDGDGFYDNEESRVHLAHRRLAIIDLAGGLQPMWNHEANIGVVFNGEIYNHMELRAQLKLRGHRFQTDHSDTEVLIHGYREWGAALPEKLQGMFAFAIYDTERKQLFLARDRFGKKPLYYTAAPEGFAFASELTALRQHPLAAGAAVDPLAVKKYFGYGYIPAPRTLYRGISKLPGGCWLRYDLTSRQLQQETYWQFAIEPDAAQLNRSLDDLSEELRDLIGKAVKKRLMSEVPLGFFLSGGVDSSLIVAEAAQLLPASQLHTFSIGFTEASFDESPYAQLVAERFGTQHHKAIFDMASAESMARKILSQMDEPLGDASILPTAAVSAFARRHVTVALGGDGGDELFAGYDPIRALAPAQWYYQTMPKLAKRAVRWAANGLPASERNMGLSFKVQRTLRGLDYPPAAWLPTWMGPLEARQIAELMQEPVSYEDLYSEAITAWETSTATAPIDRAMEFFTRFYLQDDILAKVDRASMLSSLEVRAPLLDQDLVEFARRLPHQLKYRNGKTKFLLKYAYHDRLPAAITDRPKKGFGIPLTAWMKQWPMPDSRQMPVSFNAGFVENLKQDHDRGRHDERLFLWSWMALQAQFNKVTPSSQPAEAAA